MHTYSWPVDLLSCKLKTARQKKRLVKEDQEKQLIRLYKQYRTLLQQKRNLPMVPLEQPYQKGWKRVFVLRDDVKASDSAAFYECLLEKINTVVLCNDKSFTQKAKRRKNGKRVYEGLPQKLLEIPMWEWERNQRKLTQEEMTHFHVEQRWNANLNSIQYYYTFNEPWRYKLQVMPHIIREVKVLDVLLERELQEIRSKIDGYHLWGEIGSLTKSRKCKWRRDYGKTRLMKSPIYQQNIPTILAECTNN